MKICLIRPPKYILRGTYQSPPPPPLGIALIAATLLKENYQVYAIDAYAEGFGRLHNEHIELNTKADYRQIDLLSNGLSFEEIAERISDDTDIIAFSIMFSINWPLDRGLMNFLGKKFPKAIIVGGGESITGLYDLKLRQVERLSVCVLGEGEETFLDLVKALEKGLPLSEVEGIVFKDPTTGELVKNRPRKRITFLDEVPFPAWELLPIHKYEKHQTSADEEPRVSLSIMATRGCPYSCTFCTSPSMWGTRYYMRSPDNVLAEIEHDMKKFGARNFEFYDLTAIIKKDWIMEFTNLLIEKNLNITWKIPAGTRSEAIDEEVAVNLSRSGCFSITYAPESGSPRLLKEIKKKVSLTAMLASIADAKSNGMTVFINMIIGLPGETHTDMFHTMLFLVKCKRLGVDDMPLAVFRPYPGSELFNQLVSEKAIDTSTDDFFIDTILITESFKENFFHNKAISSWHYKLYIPIIYFIFYGIDYLKNPKKLYYTIKRFSEGNYESELERKVAAIRTRRAHLAMD